MCACVPAQSFPTLCDHQAPLFMGFSRQEYYSGLPFPPTQESKHVFFFGRQLFFFHYSTRETHQVLNLVGSSWPDSLYLDLEIPTVSLLNTLRETGQVSCPKKCWRERNSQGTNCTIFLQLYIFLPVYTLKFFCHKIILKTKSWSFSL